MLLAKLIAEVFSPEDLQAGSRMRYAPGTITTNYANPPSLFHEPNLNGSKKPPQ